MKKNKLAFFTEVLALILAGYTKKTTLNIC